MKTLLNKIKLWFTRRKIMVNYLFSVQDRYEMLLDHIKTSRSITDLHKLLDDPDTNDLRILPGSDIGMGELTLSHWATGAFVANFWDTFKEGKGINFLEMKFQPTIYWEKGTQVTDALIVTIQRADGLSPSDKIRFLEKQIDELKKGVGSVH